MTELRRALEACRERTLWLLEQVPDEFVKRRVHGFYSPIGWHFGHIARTEEFWVQVQALKGPPADENLSFIFADLPDNPKDNRVNIPDRHGIVAYLNATRVRTLEALDRADLSSDDPFIARAYAWHFALQHECQHQETIAEMMHLIQMQLPQQAPAEFPIWKSSIPAEVIQIPGGKFCMGSDEPNFYDNEKRSHVVAVEPFMLDRYPVTAHRWSEFIEDGGYRREELWSDEGWKWREMEGAMAPQYWLQGEGSLASYSPNGLRALHPDEPVCGVSWFEAFAFGKWSGKRLPTEEEWEYAASFDTATGNSRFFPWGSEGPDTNRAQFGLADGMPGPIGRHADGASAFGMEDIAGSVWEWTSSRFLPYPGFNAFPYDGYSKDHMKGEHFVCRGGSWATAAPLLRCTFRNWYLRGYRQGFLGVRLAE